MKSAFIKYCFAIFFILLFNNSSFADTRIDSLLQEVSKAKSDTVKIKLWVRLSDLTFDKDSALLFCSQAAVLAEKSKSIKWITYVGLMHASWYISHGKEIDSAVWICRNLYNRIENQNYLYGIGSIYKIIGRAYMFQYIDSSLYYNLKSMEIFKKVGNEAELNGARINLGNTYYYMKRYRDAIAVTLEAFEYQQKINDLKRCGTSAINIGINFKELGNLDSAVYYMKLSLDYNVKNRSREGVAYAGVELANVYCLLKDYDNASKYYEEAVVIGTENKAKEIAYMGYAGLAKVAIDKKQWNKVLDYNTKASTFLIGNKDYEKEVYYNFYVAYEMQNDFKNSLLYYKQYIAVRDSFLGNDRIKNVDALEAKYQNNEKQARIELLKSEKEIEKSEKERQKIIRNGVVLFSLLIIAVALLVFNRFQLKGKLKQQQALLNERKRIGAELHDDLGAQLSAAHLMMENLRNKSATAADAALIENSLTMLEGSIHHLRNIMDDLKNTTLEQKGFIAATEELVNRITSIKEIKFSLSHTGMEARADRKTEHHLFRITQELINNSLKYAQAKNITLDIVKGTEKLAFMYEDDGIGFNVNAIKRGGGLSNIEQRIHSLNGTVEFDSDLKNGSRVTIHIPVV